MNTQKSEANILIEFCLEQSWQLDTKFTKLRSSVSSCLS